MPTSAYNYFYAEEPPTSQVYFEDATNLRAGICKASPQYTLDVNGDIRGSNLHIKDVTASNITVSNVIFTNELIAYSNIDIGSNFRDVVYVNGHSISQSFPETNSMCNIDWWFIADKQNRLIHPSWIQDDHSILADLWSLGELGMSLYPLLSDLFQFFNPAGNFTDALAAALNNLLANAQASAVANALQNALEGGMDDVLSNNSNEKFYVSWCNVKTRPIANGSPQGTNYDIGIKGDLYLQEDKTIRSIPAMHLSSSGRQNLTIISTSLSETVFEMGSRTAYIKDLVLYSGGSNSNVLLSGNSNKPIKIHNWFLDSNVIRNSINSNAYIDFSSNSLDLQNVKTINSNANITLSFNSNLVSFTPTFNKFEKPIICDKWQSFSNGYMNWGSNMLTQKFTSSLCNAPHTYLRQDHTGFWFDTQLHENVYGAIAPQLTQFSVESNGVYFRSNVWTNNPLILRCVQPATVQDDWKDGFMIMQPDRTQFKQRVYVNESNYTETTNISFNPNGLFLLQRNAILGQTEAIEKLDLNTMSNYYEYDFARLQTDLTDGFRYGKGIGSNLNDRDYFKITRKGEVFTYNYSNDTLDTLVNSNAEIQKGTLNILTDGTLTMSNKAVLLPEGSIVRRQHLDSNYGFKVSPSGYLTMGNLQITPGGELLTTSNASFSNLSASNITAKYINVSNPGNGNDILTIGTERPWTFKQSGTGSTTQTYFQSSTGDKNFIIASENGTSIAQFYANGTNNTLRLTRTSIGNNSITPPSSGLYVHGNVGIGSTTPAYKLDVNGSVNATTYYENGVALSSKYGGSNDPTFSNWATPKIEWTSNMMSNVDALLNDIQDDVLWNSNALSNYPTILQTDSWYRPKFQQVQWSEIQNKPDINFDSNGGVDALSVAGMTIGGASLLGTAGLWFGQNQLFNQTGQLTGVLEDVLTSGTKLTINPDGTLRAETATFQDLNISDKMSLDGASGLIDAVSGQFKYSKFTDGADFGLMTVSISNNQIFFKDGSQSNTILASNSIRVINSNNFTFSNFSGCNWDFYGGLRVGNLCITQNGSIYSGSNLILNELGEINATKINWSGLCNATIPDDKVNYSIPTNIMSYSQTSYGDDVFTY